VREGGVGNAAALLSTFGTRGVFSIRTVYGSLAMKILIFAVCLVCLIGFGTRLNAEQLGGDELTVAQTIPARKQTSEEPIGSPATIVRSCQETA
jgi:hypothetical protein